jgi:serine/threonine-protein kinase
MLSSRSGDPGRADVDAFPIDESPYGFRGGAGNSRDNCLNLWTLEGPRIDEGRLVVEAAPPESDGYRAARGGAWSSVEAHCRLAARFVTPPDQGRTTLGIRLARVVGGSPTAS